MAEQGRQMRFTDAELELIKRLFGGSSGEESLKVLRKVFLPEYDPHAPLGQGIDLWMTLDVMSVTPDVAYQRILARNQVITHIEGQLMQLSLLAQMGNSNPEEEKKRAEQDSTQ